jgi:lysophospholipase L1-like esterase
MRFVRLIVLATLFSALPAAAEQPPFLSSARVAVIGDSITEQKLYSKYVECWLLACSGIPDVQVMQFGWSGEKADGFAKRAANDLAVFHPSVATLCYGMNDGGYQPWKPEIGEAYQANMQKVLDRLDEAGVKTVVVGSPGAVDNNFFRPGQTMGEQPAHIAYNDTLAHLRDIDKRLAAEKNLRFADVHAAMIDAMRKANETRGPKYDVCGGDGFHPRGLGSTAVSPKSTSMPRRPPGLALPRVRRWPPLVPRPTGGSPSRSRADAGRSASRATGRRARARGASCRSCPSTMTSTATCSRFATSNRPG